MIQPSAQLPSPPNGVYYGQYESQDAINNGIYQRNIPDSLLRPNFDPRSIPTRCSATFPVFDQRSAGVKTPYKSYLDHSPEANFTGTKGPPAGYRVADESRLRNQYFALQHGADQRVYVPGSESELYRPSVPMTANPTPQPFPELFKREQYATSSTEYVNAASIGKDVFHNCTKTQLRISTVKN